MPVPEDLLEVLRCPACRARLEQQPNELVCTGCGLHYPVEGDVPVMLPEAASRPDHT